MRLKKTFAAFAAAAACAFACVCAVPVSVCAAESSEAVIGVADTLFSVQDFKTSVKVTGDGQYTLETNGAAGAEDIGVLTVTIKKMSKEHPDASAKLDKIEIDGKSVSFKAENVLYGDLDKNGDYRIVAADQYSDYRGDPAIDQSTRIKRSLKLTFTVSGYERAVPVSAEAKLPDKSDGKQDNKDKPSAVPDKNTPDTDKKTDPDKQTGTDNQAGADKQTGSDKQENAPAAAETPAATTAPTVSETPVPEEAVSKLPQEDTAEASAPVFASETVIGGDEAEGALSEIAIFAVIVVIAYKTYKKKCGFLSFSPKKH